MKQKLLLILGLLLFQTGHSQTLIPDVWATSGDYFANSNNSLSWTIGECITETYSNANNSLTQGFQQSKYDITSVEENSKSNSSIIVYPNPASTLINISCGLPAIASANLGSDKMKVEIIDIAGKLIHSKSFQNNTQLNISEYSNSIYLLRIYDVNNSLIKTFKLQKTN